MFLCIAAVVIAAGSAGAPYSQPQLTADADRVAAVFGSKDAVHIAVSTDKGGTFGAAVRIPTTGKLALGRHRGPRVALSKETVVVSAILAEKGGGEDGDLFAWRSEDNGSTWSHAVRINDVSGSAREGLHGMAGANGLVVAAWLDLRSRGTRIYSSSTRDGGRTWSKNALVYESPERTVCECCHPTVAIGDGGAVHVMFRNSLGGNRDMYLATSSHGGETFAPARKLGSGSWQLNACPMDGGGLTIDDRGHPVSAWRRHGDIFIASSDAGETRIGQGRDPSIAAGRSGTVTGWTTPEGLYLLKPGRNPELLDPKGRYLHVIASPDGRVFSAWERGGSILVERLE